MRTQFFISLFLAAASSTVFAMPSDAIKHSGVLEIALTGGGFVAQSDNTTYGIQLADPLNLNFPVGDVLYNDPQYKFGGGVWFGYFFSGSSINVDASYSGTRNRTTDDASGDISVQLGIPGYYGGGIGGPGDNYATAATSSYHFTYDFANVEIGSLTQVDCNGLIINPKFGLSYARLKSDQTVRYAGGLITPAQGVYTAKLDSKFDGFGPSIGFDLNYIVCNPINLIGSFRYNALAGKIDSDYLGGDYALIEINTSLESKRMIVSLIQTELALGYDFDWIDAFCGNIAVGYQLTKAIGSGEQLTMTEGRDSAAFVSSVTNSNIHGWFLRLTMDFPV